MRVNLFGKDSPKALKFRYQFSEHSLLLPGPAGAIKGKNIKKAFIQKQHRNSVPIWCAEIPALHVKIIPR
jgi:hypothetical protein